MPSRYLGLTLITMYSILYYKGDVMDIVEYSRHIASNIEAYELQQELEALDEGHVIPHIEEVYYDNTYTRTLSAGADEVHVGALHKQACLNVILEGDAYIYMLGKIKRVKAGDTFVSPPLSKKVMYTNTPTKIMNVTTVDKGMDIKDIKDSLIYTDEQEQLLYEEVVWHLE